MRKQLIDIRKKHENTSPKLESFFQPPKELLCLDTIVKLSPLNPQDLPLESWVGDRSNILSLKLLLMAEILHQFIGSLCHYS